MSLPKFYVGNEKIYLECTYHTWKTLKYEYFVIM